MGDRPRDTESRRPRKAARMSGGDAEREPATQIVEAGRRREWTGPAVNPPVWRTSTHLYSDSGDLAKGRPNEDGHYYYGRRGAPTQWALADALTGLEPGADGTILYPSGVAAIAGTLMAILRPGDRLLVTDNAYEPSRNMALHALRRFGIEARFFDPLDVERFAGLFEEPVKAVLFESPGSLTMEVCDIPALTRIARENGAVSVCDNTWASPLGFQALARGCDISIMSLTKHVGGHSDLMMGSASAAEPFHSQLRRHAQAMGQVVSPDDASLALRGLRTMHLRLERAAESALKIAHWLAGQPQVSAVLCPMLGGASGELWQRDFTGGCGLFSFILGSSDPADRDRFIDSLELFGIGYSWGGFESLVIPFDPPRELRRWPPGTEGGLGIRLSIGLEHCNDLISDLQQAFNHMDRT